MFNKERYAILYFIKCVFLTLSLILFNVLAFGLSTKSTFQNSYFIVYGFICLQLLSFGTPLIKLIRVSVIFNIFLLINLLLFLINIFLILNYIYTSDFAIFSFAICSILIILNYLMLIENVKLFKSKKQNLAT